jgi:hypothetical protein
MPLIVAELSELAKVGDSKAQHAARSWSAGRVRAQVALYRYDLPRHVS